MVKTLVSHLSNAVTFDLAADALLVAAVDPRLREELQGGHSSSSKESIYKRKSLLTRLEGLARTAGAPQRRMSTSSAKAPCARRAAKLLKLLY